ncbi:MAG: Asp-tRNA(Asn)/Glu-tRNA(Gln) amidotransferase GatCAB subunit B, partial [Desulfobacterales bacterium]|nr:Asp-tRNA(Asn)/Glu-tRNA(Gln) amidotransferase GatCAB subunit B [Desulfobacterales bacterium]
AHDYRYFPDPDLLPLIIDEDWIEAVRKTLPELPDKKKKRFITEYGLPLYDADVLTASLPTANYFEDCLKIFPETKTVGNWIMGSLMGLLNAEGKTIEQSPISSQNLAQLLKLIKEGIISGKIAKHVFEDMAKTGKSPDKIVKAKGLVQVTDVSAIEKIILNVLAENAKEVDDYRNGKTKLLAFFVGQVMKETRGKANPKIVNEVLKEKLEG